MKVEVMPAILSTHVIPADRVRLSDDRRAVGRRAPMPPPSQARPATVTQVSTDASAAFDQRIAELQQQLMEKANSLRRLEESAEAREKAAYARGHEDGLARGREDAVDRAEARVAALANGVDLAAQQFDRTLDRLAAVSTQIAYAAVEQIVGDVAEVRQRVGQVIDVQIGRLRDALPLEVRVSRLDFPDVESLTERIRGVSPGVEAVADAGLESGACHIKLKLGEVDAGISQQLRALSNVLGRQANELDP